MPAKKPTLPKKQTRPAAPSPRGAQILFAVIAVVVILSMVFSAASNF